MSKLDKLRQAFSKGSEGESSTTNFNTYRFYEMEIGKQAEVRFLPDADKDNPLGFLVEFKTHSLMINGKKKNNIPCLSMYGEDCPICKVSSDYYKADDKESGKKYWRKLTHLAQVLVVNDPLPLDSEGKNSKDEVKTIRIGFQIFNQIKSAIEDGELEVEPYAYHGGTNFIIKKDKQGDYDSYATSKFSRRESDLTDEQIDYVNSKLINLSSLLPQNPGVEAIEKMLEADLSNTTYVGDNHQSNSPKVEKSTLSGVNKIKAAMEKTQAVSEESSDEDEVHEDLAKAMIEKIRNRQKQ